MCVCVCEFVNVTFCSNQSMCVVLAALLLQSKNGYVVCYQSCALLNSRKKKAFPISDSDTDILHYITG